MIKKGIKKFLNKIGFEIKKIKNEKPNPIQLWETDGYFNVLYKEVKENTLVDKVRCFMLYQFLKQALKLDGDAAEIGVYKGGTAKLLAKIIKNKNIYLFDTFAGMPQTSEMDIHKKGDFSDTVFNDVSDYLRDFKNIFFYQGLFPETAGPIKNKIFSFVHIDVDIYKSVFDCCDFFYSRMVKGGIMIFDDYGFLSCPGAKIAVDHFFKNKKEIPCYLQSGQCLIIKL